MFALSWLNPTYGLARRLSGCSAEILPYGDGVAKPRAPSLDFQLDAWCLCALVISYNPAVLVHYRVPMHTCQSGEPPPSRSLGGDTYKYASFFMSLGIPWYSWRPLF